MTENSIRRNISESADKIQLKTKLTRGTDTRDQDTIEVRVKGNDPEAVVSRLEGVVRSLKGTASVARSIQPEASESE